MGTTNGNNIEYTRHAYMNSVSSYEFTVTSTAYTYFKDRKTETFRKKPFSQDHTDTKGKIRTHPCNFSVKFSLPFSPYPSTSHTEFKTASYFLLSRNQRAIKP